MSFFHSLLRIKKLKKHDGRPLWKYMLNDVDFDALVHELKFARPLTIDPRDVALYYAEWWKRKYHDGIPSKKEIFESISGNISYNFDYQEFYKLAKKGAQILSVKWISKQNTLYFRTLLLQGGLPLTHISENQSKYQEFLSAVLDEQPETIEDFIFNPLITSLLPKSSQNDIIYENCFEIVKSILNNENVYDDLFGSNEALTKITDSLKNRKKKLERKQRLSKPQNYWLLRFKEGETNISLRIGLADSYDVASLSNILGFEVEGREYQFYLNERLICVFRKMLNGRFKTNWYQQQNETWNGESNLPYAYVIEEGKIIKIKDFIQTIPNLQEPTLWAKYSDNEWRLIKGNGTPDKEAAILFPKQWNSTQSPEEVSICNQQLSWLSFEGEIQVNLNNESRLFLSEVNSIDWTIESQRPTWMLRTSMPVVQKKPSIIVYDNDNKKLPQDRFKAWVKRHNSSEPWQDLTTLKHLSLGCIDLKLENDGLVAYDMFYNIGSLQVNYLHKSIDSAELAIKNNDFFEFKLDESPILDIENQSSNFSLKVLTKHSKIPLGVKGSVGIRGQKKLYFEMASPFEGMAMTDKEGEIIEENAQLTLANLYGLRILSTPGKETLLRIRNRLKSDVKITLVLKESSQPVISFKDEITRLFYLADAMDYKNKVCLELIEGKVSKTYDISGFSHTLKVDFQLEKRVSLYNSEDEIDLYAVPLNCSVNKIGLIPLVKEATDYKITDIDYSDQFIIISSKVNGYQLMPRFVNTNENFTGSDKELRIDEYHSQLANGKLSDEIWLQLMAYFNICIENDIPFSTFDQLRAISRSSQVAAKAFFFFGTNIYEKDIFIQRFVPEIEKDLGFCFHWIKKMDWELALSEINEIHQYQYFKEIVGLMSSYMQENNLPELLQFINGALYETQKIYNSDISDLRAELGERVLNELPYNSPRITKDYNIPIKLHHQVRLLIQAPIAVAESISDAQLEYPIWAGDELVDSIRRNIQYCQYLNPKFYNRTILHALNQN